MNIFITGATGLIGQVLINRLSQLETGVNISVLSRNPTKVKNLLPSYVRCVTSINDIDINNIDVVINLAGEPIADKRWSKRQKTNICQSRWQITSALADKILSAEQPPSVFISGSAIGFYGRQSELKINESFTGIHQEFTHRVCQTWEDNALKASSNKTRVCLLRTGIVLSKKGGALAKMLPAFSFGLGGRIGDGKQYMSWIHIEDAVNAILTCINNSALSGAINLTAPNAVTNAVFSQSLSKALHRPCLFPMPKFMANVLFGEMAELLLFGQNVYPQKLIEQNFLFQYPNISSAFDDLI